MDNGNGIGEFHSANAQVAVLGLGHVGLPTALGLAELGWKVIGADEDRVRVALLRAAKPPFYEAGLRELLCKHLKSGKFTLADEVGEAVRSAPVLFVCVSTPQRENGEADLSHVEAIARNIARNLNGYKLVVKKSTVPAVIGQWIKRTIERCARPHRHAGAGSDHHDRSPAAALSVDSTCHFEVASNPEFLQEGKALENFFHPDRIVLGVESEKARQILEQLYRPLNCKFVVTTLNTAELIKHAANAFLATKISFINMVADLCEAVDADVNDVAHALGLDPRIGPHFLSPGIGFGGYCLPKDLRAFIHLAEEHGVDFSLLKEVERINRGRIDLFLRKLESALWVVRGKTIGILGLAFKPGTDDVRDAPSLRIIEALLRERAVLRLYDPKAMGNTQLVFPEQPGRLTYCPSPYAAAQGAEALLILTEWDEFRQLDLPRLRHLMEAPVLLDGRGVCDPDAVRSAGFEYVCMGRHDAGNVPFNRAPQLVGPNGCEAPD